MRVLILLNSLVRHGSETTFKQMWIPQHAWCHRFFGHPLSRKTKLGRVESSAWHLNAWNKNKAITCDWWRHPSKSNNTPGVFFHAAVLAPRGKQNILSKWIGIDLDALGSVAETRCGNRYVLVGSTLIYYVSWASKGIDDEQCEQIDWPTATENRRRPILY